MRVVLLLRGESGWLLFYWRRSGLRLYWCVVAGDKRKVDFSGEKSTFLLGLLLCVVIILGCLFRRERRLFCELQLQKQRILLFRLL